VDRGLLANSELVQSFLDCRRISHF
jgi:hypothetical protein